MRRRLTLKDFFIITRAWSLNLSFISVTLATVIASKDGPVSLILYILCLLGAMATHLGANGLNDYYDSKNKIDTPEAPTALYRPHPVFTQMVEPRELFLISSFLLIFSFGLGIILAIFRSSWLWPLIFLGLFLAIFYTAKPIGLKYRGFGEPAMFLAFGPLMMEGTYVTQRSNLSWKVFYLSVPIGLLVALVLLANNLRDRVYDKNSKIKTLSSFLGHSSSLRLFVIISMASFGLILFYIFVNLLSYKALLIFLALPINIALMREFSKTIPPSADGKTSQFTLIFGLLFIASLLLEK